MASTPSSKPLSVPDGFLRFSDAISRLAEGMWGGLPRPVPVQAIKRIEKKASIGFGPRRERAGQRLTAAVTTIKTAEGDVKLLGLLTIGILIIGARDFDALHAETGEAEFFRAKRTRRK